jgi:hypothetical protein
VQNNFIKHAYILLNLESKLISQKYYKDNPGSFKSIIKTETKFLIDNKIKQINSIEKNKKNVHLINIINDEIKTIKHAETEIINRWNS